MIPSESATARLSSPVPLSKNSKFIASPRKKSTIKPYQNRFNLDFLKLEQFVKSLAGSQALLAFIQYSIRFSLISRRRKSGELPNSTSGAALLKLVSLLSAIRRILAVIGLLSTSKSFLNSGFKFSIPPFIPLLQSQLDSIVILLDMVFFLGKIKLLPIRSKQLKKIDTLSDLVVLCASSLSIWLITTRISLIWQEAGTIRKEMLKSENQLLETEFWNQNKGEVGEELEERIRVEQRARRSKLKALRSELNLVWMERVRLIGDWSFSGTSLIGFDNGIFDSLRALAGLATETVGLSQAWNDFVRP